MELKDYQQKVLERFEDYLAALKTERDKSVRAVEALKAAGVEMPQGLDDFPRNAWAAMKARGTLPRFKSPQGLIVPNYVQRWDSCNRPMPHVCLKVPTGGGKTLLACESIGRVQVDYFCRQTGLVLWVVPTVQIYRQTWKALANREHPYRQMLERASGGRVKLLEKDDPFTAADTQHYLCIMLVRLAATNRTNNKDFLKIFRDAGKYTSFFPEVDDFTANSALLAQHPDLETGDMVENIAIAGVPVKHSLVNVFKMLCPVVVIDEGHKAYSDNTRKSLNDFNPSFVLELTATPNARDCVSNVLVDVSGVDLKDEQMIKLPINIINTSKGDWHSTLTQAHAKRGELEQLSLGVHASDGRYIRPILVVRVERTGKDQRDGKKIHADDAKEFLMKNLVVEESHIRIKSSEKDELGSEDLRDPLCPVRFIITKEALQEGWDCPFAYVLALLDRTTASTAMTQMVGRILRQPETRATSVAAMNECYVFCYDQDVKDAVEHVRKGLEEEGMTGLGEFVRAAGSESNSAAEAAEVIHIKRRDKFKDLQVFLPRVLHAEGDSWREINYETDILSNIAWGSLAYDPALFLDGKDSPATTITRVDVAKKADLPEAQQSLDLMVETRKADVWIEKRIDLSFLVRQLIDIIPNPWQATRIVEDALNALRAKGQNDEALFNNRLFLIDSIKRHLKQLVHNESEAIFRTKLANGKITFRLVTNGNARLNFEIARELKQLASKQDRKLVRKDNTLIDNSLFEFVFEKEFNSLEKDLALYLADDEAVAWWHRMVARQDYSLQGWQRNKVYPDFIACVNDGRILVLETKGLQLKGNDDTEYKQKLLSLLTGYHHALPAGEIALTKGKKQSITFAMLMEDSWRDAYNQLRQ